MTISDLKNVLTEMKNDWASFQVDMAHGILKRKIKSEKIYTAGPFSLTRFITELNTSEENHIGEAIVNENGCIEYLKTYRLSSAQTRRAYLLSHLARNNWNIDATSASLNQSRNEFIKRMEKAGFGYLLKDEVLHQAKKRKGR